MPDAPGTSLERREIVVPGTGELVALDDPPAVARALQEVRRFKVVLDDARAALERALVEESARAGTKTLRFGATVARVGADSEIEWDVTELVKLRDAGLPEDRYDQLVRAEVTYKVDGRVAREVAASNPEYAEIVERARVRRPRRPSVSVGA